MSGEAQGQVVERRRGGATRYGFRFTLAGWRYYATLGAECCGQDHFVVRGGSLGGGNRRHLTPAERALIVLGGGFVAGDSPAGRSRGSRRAGR